VSGADFILESCTLWWCSYGDHGPGTNSTCEDSGLQLLTGTGCTEDSVVR